jgi:surface polysaccharide O-acyltransferase-like enzyme
MSAAVPATTFAPSAPIQLAAPATARFARLEMLRLVAALAVIWIHVPRSPELGWTTVFCRFAVPLFVAGAAYFAVKAATKPLSSRDYVLTRVQRIYVPFLAWSAVYLLFKVAKARLLPDQPNDFPGVEFFWTGGAYHLWFMPLVLIVCGASFLLARAVRTKGMTTAATIAAMLALAISLTPAPTSDDALQLMWEALPAGILGWIMGVTDSTWKWLPLPRAAQIVCLLLIAGIVVGEAALGRQLTAEALLGGLVLCLALSPAATRPEQHLAPLGRLAIGVYFVHLLWVKVIEALTNIMHYETCWQMDLFTFTATALLSLVTVVVLARQRATAWLVT